MGMHMSGHEIEEKLGYTAKKKHLTCNAKEGLPSADSREEAGENFVLDEPPTLPDPEELIDTPRGVLADPPPQLTPTLFRLPGDAGEGFLDEALDDDTDDAAGPVNPPPPLLLR